MKILEIIPELTRHRLFLGVDLQNAAPYWNEQTMSLSSFEDGETAYSSECDRVRVGILLAGCAQIYTGVLGEATLLRTLQVGELFGIANLYAEEEAFPTQIIAKGSCRMLFIDGDAFRAFVENDRTLLQNFLAFQSRKIVYLNRKITTFTAGSAEKKLALFLHDYESDGVFIPPCSMSALSDMLGMGRASLYRALDSLAAQGLIERQNKNILIPDKNALLRFI